MLCQRRFARCEEHDHVAAFAFGRLLDLGWFLKILGHAPEQNLSKRGVLNLAAAENHGAFHFVASLEETLGLADSHVVIVLINFVSHLDLFNFGLVRFFLGFLGLFLLFEFVFAVIHDPANRWISFFAHQNKIQFPFFGH